MTDLQTCIDGLADLVGRAISVEDRQFRLVAHSAHDGAADAVRRASILSRRSTPEVVEYLGSCGIEHALGIAEVPSNPELGMDARLCVALRHDGLLLGFMWILNGAVPPGETERSALIAGAAVAAACLWKRRRDDDARRQSLASNLAQLLSGSDLTAAAHAVLADLGWPNDGPFVAALGLGDADAGDRARRRWRHGELALGVWRGRVLVVAHLPRSADPEELAATLQTAGADRAGVGGIVRRLEELAVSVDGAEIAVLVAEADGRPTATLEHLGAWALITELWVAAGRPAAPPMIARLEAHRHGQDLVRTLEATLDAGGNMAAAAEELHIHRATLYRRLERIAELTGLDLDDGDDRLLAHLGLRLRRLSRLMR